VLDLNPVEMRVLACLIEKQRTTPDTYPLTLNALRLACNQSTNREPVVEYDESTIRAALERLARRRYVRLASGHTTRATKYRHLLDDTLQLSNAQLSVLAVLMLRGPQTPGELRQRTERLHRFGGNEELEEVLSQLSDREYIRRLERRPGQKEQRYRLLTDDEDEAAPEPQPPTSDLRPPTSEGEARLTRLEEQVAQLRAELDELRSQLGA
jgi:uncharacterized protein